MNTPTIYALAFEGQIHYTAQSIRGLFFDFKLGVRNDGHILYKAPDRVSRMFVNKEPRVSNISYNLDEFSKDDAMVDFIERQNEFKEYVRAVGYKVYKEVRL